MYFQFRTIFQKNKHLFNWEVGNGNLINFDEEDTIIKMPSEI